MTRPRRFSALVVAALLCGALAGCSTAAAPAPSPSTTSRIALPADPTVYFFGDSWTTGYDADEGRGFPHVVGEALDWNVVLGPDSSGAGYTYTFNPYHPVFPQTVREIDRIDADLIVLQGSVNDLSGSTAELPGKIRETVQQLRARSDDTPVVMVGPAPYQTEVPQELSEIDRIESEVARDLHVDYISPLRERWFSAGIVQALIDERQHPTTAGHAYFGGRLAADLSRITTTGSPSAATAVPEN